MKKMLIVNLFLITSIFILISGAIIIYSEFKFLPGLKHGITGNVNSGSISIYIESGAIPIVIDSPLNTTYNFNPGSNYTLDLNVSSTAQNISSWWYRLYDLTHGLVVNETVYFSPNTTFTAVRRSNELTVYVNNTNGELGSKKVVFYVNVLNTAPLLGNISTNIYACEGGSLAYPINATDPDEDDLTFSISPLAPFFIFPSFFSGQTFVQTNIISGTLGKSHLGGHNELVSVDDGQNADTKSTNITVIEINNAPSVSNIGVQTIWNKGENSTLRIQVAANDLESGNSYSGNLNFNISFENESNLFDINNTGVINFSAIGQNASLHNITICVKDNGLSQVHPNISLCGQDGSNMSVCRNFTLTITDANRAPEIISWSPASLFLNATGDEKLVFNISKKDPDGTIPDSYWFVDGQLKGYFSGQSNDTFNYTFGCGISGIKNVSVSITDGLLNDSLEWRINLTEKQCPVSSSGGGGGGGGGGGCSERWFCNVWSTCQNLEVSFNKKFILESDYTLFRANCSANKLGSERCGYQIRDCTDLNKCGSILKKSDENRYCQYTEKPSCSDNIQNCHNGDCEILTDCGGPCVVCTTCSDRIKNQGEKGIDCGSPCPNACGKEPLSIRKITSELNYAFVYGILLILLILIIITLIRLIRAIKRKSQEEGLKWYSLLLKDN